MYYKANDDCQLVNLNELYTKHFGERSHGVFVEVGANDGEAYSNTCMLADLGWQGYYIEPLPDKALECAIRHAKNNVIVTDVAIASEAGRAKFYRSADEFAAGSTLMSSAEAEEYAGKFATEIEVETMRLDTYLKEHNVKPGFDILNIDTEGTDIDVLLSFDVEEYHPTMIIIETNCSKDKTRIIKEILSSYTLVSEDDVNCVFVLSSHIFAEYKERIGKEVRAIMSVPRLIMSDCARSIDDMYANLHVENNLGGGAYWGQTMNRVMNRAIESGCKYILAIDSDTYFNSTHIVRLYDIMDKRPDIDCIAAMQTQRIIDRIICGFKDEDLDEGIIPPWILFADTFEATYAHFGLTLIRTEKLVAMPKPWFWSYPGKDGDWGDDRIDEDIWFWNKWKEAGNNVHIANKVVVGHLELMATYPDKTLRKRYYHPSDIVNNGIPAEVWPMRISAVYDENGEPINA